MENKQKFYSLFDDKYFDSFEEFVENGKNWNKEKISISSLKFLLNFFVQDFITNFMIYNNHLTNEQVKIIIDKTFLDALNNSNKFFPKEEKGEE